MTTIGLVGCAAAKLRRPAPARDLYVSQLFKKAAAYADEHADRWYVLSAKYGLVTADEVIEPYDVKLGSRTGPPIWDWAADVANQLRIALLDVPDPELLVLAGEQYRTFLRLVDYPARAPMEGMGIGHQLQFLTNALGPAHRRNPESGDYVKSL
jgi:hypothetical protein